MDEYTVFKFLRFFPVPERLKAPVPVLEILKMKVPLPNVLERSITELFPRPKKKPVRRKLKSRIDAGDEARNGAFTGPLARGAETPYSINGQDIKISETTWIFGELRIGIEVQVQGSRDLRGRIEAQKIIVL